MTPEGEKQMLELLSEIRVRLARIEAIASWYKEKDQRRSDVLAALTETMPQVKT